MDSGTSLLRIAMFVRDRSQSVTVSNNGSGPIDDRAVARGKNQITDGGIETTLAHLRGDVAARPDVDTSWFSAVRDTGIRERAVLRRATSREANGRREMKRRWTNTYTTTQ